MQLLLHTLPQSNSRVSCSSQALALDERRANFIPSVWDHAWTNPDTQDVQEVWFKGGHTDVGGGAPVPPYSPGQSSQSTLSNIALRWMIRQCLELDTGIIFDHRALRTYRDEKVLEVRPSVKDDNGNYIPKPDFESRLLKASAALDCEDIVYKPYDAMGWNLGWNALELLPVAERTTETGGWFGNKRTYGLSSFRLGCLGFR